MNKKVEYISKKIEELEFADYNPRWISKSSLKGLTNSMKEFGIVQPIVWNKRTNRVVGGHQRLRAAKSEGIDEVDVVVVDLSDEDEVALNIALNSEEIRGEWDLDKMGLLLAEIEEDSTDFFDSLLISELKTSIGVVDDFDYDEEDNLTPDAIFSVCKEGDVWAIGRHRLVCGEPDAKSFEKVLQCDEVDCFITNLNGRSPESVDCIGNTPFSSYNVIYVIVSPEDHVRARQTIRSFESVYMALSLIYLRNEARPKPECSFDVVHDSVIYGWVNHHKFYGTTTSNTIIEEKDFKLDSQGSDSPVELYSKLICNGTKIKNVVLDPMAGKGTTLIVCERASRKARLIENDPKNCDIILNRYASIFGEKEIVREDGKTLKEVIQNEPEDV